MTQTSQISDTSPDTPQHVAGMSAYLNSVGLRDLLTVEEETLLARRKDRGDAKARQLLVEHNLRLVVSIAREFTSGGTPLDDLVQEGNIGLMHAVDKFDCTQGVRLANYAAFWIKKKVRRAADEYRSAMRLPHKKWEQMHSIRRTETALAAKLGHSPTDEQVAEAITATPAAVKELRSAAAEAVALDAPLGDEDDRTVADTLIGDASLQPDTAAFDAACEQAVAEALTGLEDMLRETIEMRYGLAGHDEHLQTEVGERTGVSGQAIGKRERKALTQLAAAAPQLEAFIG